MPSTLPAVLGLRKNLVPDAASRLFHDRCPKTPAGGELNAHRADVAERKAQHDKIMEKYRTKPNN